MARYALDRGSKQTYIYIVLKMSIAIGITIAIDESALTITTPVQGGKDDYHLYMHSPLRISTKNNDIAPLLNVRHKKAPTKWKMLSEILFNLLLKSASA